MTYAIAKQIKQDLEAAVAVAGNALKVFPKAADGLTPDSIKISPAFRAAKQEYDLAFSRLRAFNEDFLRAYKNEYQADRRKAGRYAA